MEAFRGYPDRAFELLVKAAKEYDHTTDAKYVSGLEKLCLALLRLNAHSQLQDLLKPLNKIESRNHVLLFCLAEAYRRLLKPGRALEVLNKTEQSVPVLWSKSSVLLDLRRYEESMEVCRSLLSLFPDDWTLSQHMGRCYEGFGNRAEALLSYQKALELNPGDFASYCAVMDQALALGKMKLLQVTFHQLLAREIAPPNVLDYWGMHVAGQGSKAKEVLLK